MITLYHILLDSDPYLKCRTYFIAVKLMTPEKSLNTKTPFLHFQRFYAISLLEEGHNKSQFLP